MLIELSVRTNRRTEFIDITPQIEAAIREHRIRDALCHIWVPHTTAGITVNEHADPSVARDILFQLNKVIPFDDDYAHLEGNSAAHIKATLVGCSLNAIVQDGRLKLGTWQGVFFCEFDGPRQRKVWVKFLTD
ncbi:MAG: YjbQ family protein [Calditrichaeota bacterium]|nr:MAG: YjbQ family protein [Calditrichota bacterium]